ncbi:MAG: lipopolysaccharide biosynthesis protein RfbH [Gammaproteobacteria bacterium GWE2_42_36]|nr:MAG: lipopolysaccharide biosynthesis protein RfbH [Gammaproteobacteria bacterium GWE2_42_36]
MSEAEQLKKTILEQVKQYYELVHSPKHKKFLPGQSRVPYAGRVFDEHEMTNLVDAALEFWLTEGRFTDQFEKSLAKKLGVNFSLLVNSGSSANLLAFMTLTSPLLGKRQIQRGDEVITVAAGFPTTVAPMIQYGAIPVFVDVVVEDGTYNIDCKLLEQALSEKTKLVMVAHTLGNPFDLAQVKAFCQRHQLWLIEDNCDALGSRYQGRYTGTFGDIGTSSFYPPHHMTMGEGGAVYMNDPLLKTIARSMRDWGRDCICPSGKDDTCQRRFATQHGILPVGYDHKYVYSHFGYNLKATDLQAAIGCAQLEKLEAFTEKRKNNWQHLYDGLKSLTQYFVLPQATPNTEPSWFGFLLSVKPSAGFSRSEIVNFLENHGVQTRMLFAGNLTRHPCFDELRRKNTGYRMVGDLTHTDFIMHHTFWVGVYPGMSTEQLDYMIKMICDFVAR